jgi:1,4-alpha-glucan branching enzyme
MPRYGVYAPVQCPSGVAAFGRDIETSRQVWSSVEGYPGDFDYRDFYRDTGFDSESEHIKAYVDLFGARTYTGFKYYRITGKTDHKQPYVLKRAMEKAHEHAENFILNRENQIDYLSDTFGIKPLIVSTYDAELFGHWWFEGIEWLDFLLRVFAAIKETSGQ